MTKTPPDPHKNTEMVVSWCVMGLIHPMISHSVLTENIQTLARKLHHSETKHTSKYRLNKSKTKLDKRPEIPNTGGWGEVTWTKVDWANIGTQTCGIRQTKDDPIEYWLHYSFFIPLKMCKNRTANPGYILRQKELLLTSTWPQNWFDVNVFKMLSSFYYITSEMIHPQQQRSELWSVSAGRL